MKFSVVIPSYNKQHELRRAVQSVIDQDGYTSDCYEVIIVDDGSTDESLKVAQQIQRENPSQKLIVHSQRNAGVSAARNKGIELSSTNLIAFLDADDTYESNFLSEIEQLATRYPEAAMYATGYRYIDASTGATKSARLAGLESNKPRQLLADFFYSAAYGDLPVTSSSVCIRKAALEECGGFPEGQNMGEDQAVWSSIALKQKVAISTVNCANYFENTQNSLMQTVSPSDEMPYSLHLQTLLDGGLIAPVMVASLKKYIATHLLDLVRRNLNAGDLNRANKFVRDVRARALLKRWLYWSVRVRVAAFVKKVSV